MRCAGVSSLVAGSLEQRVEGLQDELLPGEVLRSGHVGVGSAYFNGAGVSMTNEQFINALTSAANAYPNNLPYALFPPPSGNTYNSNSYVSGVITAAGGTPPNLGLPSPW